jgi:hypothetical protein
MGPGDRAGRPVAQAKSRADAGKAEALLLAASQPANRPRPRPLAGLLQEGLVLAEI